MSHPSSPSSSSVTPPPSSPLHAAGAAFLIPSPLRAKKSRVEAASSTPSPPPPPLKPSSARALSTSADVAHLKPSKAAVAAAGSSHDELDAIDQQVSGGGAQQRRVAPHAAGRSPASQLCAVVALLSCASLRSRCPSTSWSETVSRRSLRPLHWTSLPSSLTFSASLLLPSLSTVVSLFQDLSSAPSSSASRLPLVRSIKNKLIGSELNKRVVLSQHCELVLVHLLRELVEEDDSTHDDLRLELMTALASLAAHHTEGADRLLQNDFLPLVLLAVRGGLPALRESGVRALKHLVHSCSPQPRDDVVRRVFQHVDVVAGLVQAVRQWQGPLSELAVDVLVRLCSTQEQRLCLIQHGLLAALLAHIAAKRPLSSASFSVPVPFLASLRLLSALVEDNAPLVLFLSSAPALASSPFAALSMTASSLFSFCASLLLHADCAVKLFASSLLLSSALVHLSLARRGQRHPSHSSWLSEEEEHWRRSDLLRLHADFHASPIGKRGRGGSDKSARKSKDGDRAAPFPLHQWLATLRPAALTAASPSTSLPSPSLQLLSSLLPRVLHVLTRLLETGDADVVAAAYPLLTRAVDGNDACQEEVGQVLPALLQHLLQLTVASSPLPSPHPPISLRPVLRLLSALCAHETNRRVVLSIAAYSGCLLHALSSPLEPRSPALALALRTLARLATSHRFHLCDGLAASPPVVRAVLSSVTAADLTVSIAAVTALTALLAPHTSVRGDLLRAFTPPVTDRLFALARGTTSPESAYTGGDDTDAVAALSPRVVALGALAAWAQRASAAAQAVVVRGLGGWRAVVSMVEEKVDDPAVFCAVLRLVQPLVAGGTSAAEARDLDDWSRPGAGVDGEGKGERAEERGCARDLTRADVDLVLQALVTRMAPQGGGGLSGVGDGVEEAVLGVLSNVATHPACTSSMLLASTPVLAFLLQCLRSSRSSHREAAVCVLHHSLLTLASEEEESLAAAAAWTTSSRKSRAAPSAAASASARRSAASAGAASAAGTIPTPATAASVAAAPPTPAPPPPPSTSTRPVRRRRHPRPIPAVCPPTCSACRRRGCSLSWRTCAVGTRTRRWWSA